MEMHVIGETPQNKGDQYIYQQGYENLFGAKKRKAGKQAAKAEKKPIPAPRYRPFIYQPEYASADKVLVMHDGSEAYMPSTPKPKKTTRKP